MYMRKRLLQDMSNKEREREQVMPLELILSRFTFKIILLKSSINENIVVYNFLLGELFVTILYICTLSLICTKKIGRNISYIDARELQFFPLSSIDMFYKIHM